MLRLADHVLHSGIEDAEIIGRVGATNTSARTSVGNVLRAEAQRRHQHIRQPRASRRIGQVEVILLRVASEQTDDREIDLPCDRWTGQEHHTLLHGGRRDTLASNVDLEVGELSKASRQDEDGFIGLTVCGQETNGGMGLCHVVGVSIRD